MPKAPDSISDLYLAYRQAKICQYFERRGVGALALATFEEDLSSNLKQLSEATRGDQWFNNLEIGPTWIVPKNVDSPKPDNSQIIRLGPHAVSSPPILNIQTRLSPSPEFATIEVKYLHLFGPQLERLLSPNAVGYRLDTRDGRLSSVRRWLFEYWPSRYNEFRTKPLKIAKQLLSQSLDVIILSADLANCYDTIDPSFLLSQSFLDKVSNITDLDINNFVHATSSLLEAYQRFYQATSRQLGVKVSLGLPIGSLTSRLVANLALTTLDEHIESNSNVYCYLRYVDDMAIVATSNHESNIAQALHRFFPLLRGQSEETVNLDCKKLLRPGSDLQLKESKTRVHSLSGSQGLDFIDSVSADFGRVVSRSRSFLDPATLSQEDVRLFSAGKDPNSPLRVLRDADRVRLERLALSTRLMTLQRASLMIDPGEARSLVRTTLESVTRILNNDGHWVESLETTLKLLKLAVSTSDWESAAEISGHLDQKMATVEHLKTSVARVLYRGRQLDMDRRTMWVVLRNYLHHRRLEAVAATLPLTTARLIDCDWLRSGIRVETSVLKRRALQSRAKLLARADLRLADREDDFQAELFEPHEKEWMVSEISSANQIKARLSWIDLFLDVSRTLGDYAWLVPPARLFLSTRPPSYFDIARRFLYRIELTGFVEGVFERLLHVVNAVRGTNYSEPVGRTVDEDTVDIPWIGHDSETMDQNPLLMLGNLSVPNAAWAGAAERRQGSRHGRPLLTLSRLAGLAKVLEASTHAAVAAHRKGTPSILVLPELSVPRNWFRSLATYVVRQGRYGAVIGLEYLHNIATPSVVNQAYAILPGPYMSVATWPWTKRLPARGERINLAKLTPPLQFPNPGEFRRRPVVRTPWGRFSVLICSELIEARRVADLLGRVELVLVPSWNKDTASYDHLIQSVGLNLHAIIAVSNNGIFSDCRAWAPRFKRHERDLCRLIERHANDIVCVELPIQDLVEFRSSDEIANSPFRYTETKNDAEAKWKPLPPDWSG